MRLLLSTLLLLLAMPAFAQKAPTARNPADAQKKLEALRTEIKALTRMVLPSTLPNTRYCGLSPKASLLPLPLKPLLSLLGIRFLLLLLMPFLQR